jgi:hypothetical protein
MFIFTRYLYEKEEVEIALKLSLLEKKIEESLFWAYELFYSGFQKELFLLFIQFYYDFYATLNPAFGIFIVIKYNEYFIEKKEVLEERFISMLVHDFIIRPFNLDIFNLSRQDTYLEKNSNNLEYLLENNLYSDIGNYIFQLEEDSIQTNLEKVIYYFKNKRGIYLPKNIKKHLDNYFKVLSFGTVKLQTIFLFIILHYYSLENNLKMGKNIYVITLKEEIDIFKNVLYEPCYQTLPNIKLFNINNSRYLHLFDLKREKEDIHNAYWYHWLYHASFCPLWLFRIEKYHGKVNDHNKKIDFEDIDFEDEFYEEFNLEPDEQPKEIQEKSIQKIEYDEKLNWDTFYHTFGKNSLIKCNLIKKKLKW